MIYHENRKNSSRVDASINDRTPLLDTSGSSSDVVLIQPVNLNFQVILILFKRVSLVFLFV